MAYLSTLTAKIREFCRSIIPSMGWHGRPHRRRLGRPEKGGWRAADWALRGRGRSVPAGCGFRGKIHRFFWRIPGFSLKFLGFQSHGVWYIYMVYDGGLWCMMNIVLTGGWYIFFARWRFRLVMGVPPNHPCRLEDFPISRHPQWDFWDCAKTKICLKKNTAASWLKFVCALFKSPYHRYFMMDINVFTRIISIYGPGWNNPGKSEKFLGLYNILIGHN